MEKLIDEDIFMDLKLLLGLLYRSSGKIDEYSIVLRRKMGDVDGLDEVVDLLEAVSLMLYSSGGFIRDFIDKKMEED